MKQQKTRKGLTRENTLSFLQTKSKMGLNLDRGLKNTRMHFSCWIGTNSNWIGLRGKE
jgi:hypothetical protein